MSRSLLLLFKYSSPIHETFLLTLLEHVSVLSPGFIMCLPGVVSPAITERFPGRSQSSPHACCLVPRRPCKLADCLVRSFWLYRCAETCERQKRNVFAPPPPPGLQQEPAAHEEVPTRQPEEGAEGVR